MSPFEPLQPDIRQQQQRTMCIADTRTIALIASKKNFNPEFEVVLMLEEEFNTQKIRETGYHRMGVLV